MNNYILYAFVSVHLILEAVFISKEYALTEKGYVNGTFIPGEGRLFTPCWTFVCLGRQFCYTRSPLKKESTYIKKST